VYLRNQVSKKDNVCPQKSEAVLTSKSQTQKADYLSVFQTVPVLFVCFLFLHSKHVTAPDVYINRNESVCSCCAQSPCVTISDFHQKAKVEVFPQLSSKALCISLGTIAQRSTQPAQVDHLGGASAFKDLEEICKVCSLDPKWLWS